MEVGLRSDADATLFSKLLSSLKLKAEEEKTSGTWFVPTDRVSGSPEWDLECRRHPSGRPRQPVQLHAPLLMHAHALSPPCLLLPPPGHQRLPG